MKKYRIVKRPSAGTYCYFSQEKWLFGWVDMPNHSCSNCETPSHSLELVENYVENIILKKKDIVVKTYE